uniref:Uncharacterized protein n=1 Tax=Arion vulgaris TaxID=1028688 RepID=A0A0B7AIP9_9EUPU
MRRFQKVTPTVTIAQTRKNKHGSQVTADKLYIFIKSLLSASTVINDKHGL